MTRFVIGVGLAFAALMIALLYVLEHSHVESMAGMFHAHVDSAYAGLSTMELSLFFSIFVMLQMWNLFNAKAFATGQSAFHLRRCGEFLMIVAVVFFGQIAIVTLGGDFFGVEPLGVSDWLWIIALTSPVLIIGEAMRLSGLARRKPGR